VLLLSYYGCALLRLLRTDLQENSLYEILWIIHSLAIDSQTYKEELIKEGTF
jgi:hypothetical protein